MGNGDWMGRMIARDIMRQSRRKRIYQERQRQQRLEKDPLNIFNHNVVMQWILFFCFWYLAIFNRSAFLEIPPQNRRHLYRFTALMVIVLTIVITLVWYGHWQENQPVYSY